MATTMKEIKEVRQRRLYIQYGTAYGGTMSKSWHPTRPCSRVS
ncbi:MAG: hypothetical protein ACLTEX_00760 [Eggerthella lenta]